MGVSKNTESVTIFPVGEGFIYKVLDGSNNEIGRIIWDGQSPYDVVAVFGEGAHLQYLGTE